MYYVILSQGEYSDYRQTWFGGPNEITQEEFDEVGVRFGDELTKWYYGLEKLDYGCKNEEGKIITEYDLAGMWNEKMISWLEAQGYETLKSSAEINVAYSDIPVSKNKVI